MDSAVVHSILVPLAGGRFSMGSDAHYPEEAPRHEAEVAPFSISPFAVTNAEFAEFVLATGYRTTAEIPLDPASAPGMPSDYFEAGSLVFKMTDEPVDLRDFRQWWQFVPGANWRHPEGPGSTLDGRMDHPVVQVSLFDALAYCNWAGLRLPTEKQWEFAANGGAKTDFPWGASLTDGRTLHANTWHGRFPFENTRRTGAPFSDPVDSFKPNGFGLFNMIGNVWEWTASRYTSRHDGTTCCTPAGRPSDGMTHVVKGGSFLCAPSYCKRYRAAARSPQEVRSSTNHLGFRCIVR